MFLASLGLSVWISPVRQRTGSPQRGGARNSLGPRRDITCRGPVRLEANPLNTRGKMVEVSTYRPGGDAHGGAAVMTVARRCIGEIQGSTLVLAELGTKHCKTISERTR